MISKLKNQKGIALMLAMFTIILVSYLATELAYETNVEYLINSQSIQRVKAYYAAKSGIELSLLRIKLYSQIKQQLKSQLGDNANSQMKLIDMIWTMPFSWPPILPEGLNQVDKGMMQDKIKESTMDTSYMTTISDEGSKIDLNDLNSPVKAIKDLTKKRLLQIFENKTKNDDKWAREHGDLRSDEIVNSISDWVTPGDTSANGGDKRSRFSQVGEGLPPNRAFRTVDELHLIPGVTDDVFNLLKDQVTVYGMRAVNPNYASKEVLMSLDPSITSDIADEIIKRRDAQSTGGLFKTADEFWSYISTLGAHVDSDTQKNLPITCDSVYNFRIKSTGSYKNTTREITVVVFDVQKSAETLAGSIKKENSTTATSKGTSTSSGSNNSASKGPPRIVYWNEK